ncbi:MULTISPECIES: hypothetical protein [unclassified Bradyrhizobium]|uniref:hypothetical protein n=1 Tax=unclassified Bradyrhizobium TaxID=2631580 RepID=UPI00291625A4|nr:MULTISPECIES: hypothetical protein [unclassified Bradyrhizobium]
MRETSGARHLARERGLVRERETVGKVERGSARVTKGEAVLVFGKVVTVTGRVLVRKIGGEDGER